MLRSHRNSGELTVTGVTLNEHQTIDMSQKQCTIIIINNYNTNNQCCLIHTYTVYSTHTPVVNAAAIQTNYCV